MKTIRLNSIATPWLIVSLAATAWAAEPVSKAFIDGTGPGWKEMGEADFVHVNCAPDTWSWKEGIIHCTGQPVGVIRSQQTFTNFGR